MKPPNESGGMVAQTAACVMKPSPKDSDDLGASVKPEQMAAWIDEAIFTLRRAATDPVEFQRLGLWLQRMRRALQ
jgi:hypothetical protein